MAKHSISRRPDSQPAEMPPEILDEATRIYLGILALRQPFTIEITASPYQMFEELASNWPAVDGWEGQANILRNQIQMLADPLIESGNDSPLHLAINVAESPQVPLPAPDAAAVHAVFDADHGFVTHRSYSAEDTPFDPRLEEISLGMAVLYQPFPHGKRSKGNRSSDSVPPVLYPRRDKLPDPLAEDEHATRPQGHAMATIVSQPSPPSPKSMLQPNAPTTSKPFSNA